MHDQVSTIAATDWGSVPDWIGGIGTATATLLLTIGWWRESRHRRHDQERQSAVAIRQLLLDIEDLYAAEREQDGSLASAADPNLLGTAARSTRTPRSFRRTCASEFCSSPSSSAATEPSRRSTATEKVWSRTAAPATA